MTVAVPSPARPGTDEAQRRWQFPEWGALLLLLVALLVYFSMASENFLNANNFLNILSALSILGVIAAPATLLLISGNFDLSVGATAVICGVVLAQVAGDASLGSAVVVAILLGVGIGAANGFFVTVIGVNSLITTLGMLAVLQGLAQVLSDGQTVIVEGFGFLGTSKLGSVPVSVIVLVIFLLAYLVTMRWTVFGRSMYAIGANPVAARLVGMRTRWLVFVGFMLSGLSAAVGGLMMTSQLSAASPTAAQGLELSVVTAVVLGGTQLHGGKGTIVGTILGLLIIGVLNNGLVLLDVNVFYQNVARGALLIGAVSLDQLRTKLAVRRG